MKPFFCILAIVMMSLTSKAQEALSVQETSFPQETLAVQNLLEQTEVAWSMHWCVQGKLTCRGVFRLKDKATGQLVESFYENFFSSERKVGSTSYFLKNTDGTFRVYADDIFDGQVIIDRKDAVNQNVIVNFNGDGLPQMPVLRTKKLGTTRYGQISISYSLTASILAGFEKDELDPNLNDQFSVTYLRVP